MRFWMALAAASLWTSTAAAVASAGSDKVTVAVQPSWVRPASVPAASAAAAGAAFQLLVQDQQVSFEPGAKTVFTQTVLKVQTPQGLAGGAINFAWNPDFDQPVVHKLQIRRGDKVIDVLASQSFTVVRRESNLEHAMLDGVLTATLQPEGLQVGDVVDFAVSIRSAAPLLGGHLEQIGGGWNGVPVGLASFRATWPAAMNVRLRQTEGLPTIRVTETKEGKRAEVALDALQPLTPPKGAPPRFHMLRMIELSDLGEWSELAARMAPLYTTASALPDKGPLRDEANRIRAASADPAARVQAALSLVQDRVRYVFLGMNGGNYVPADAVTTWSRRFGDCKGKTALLLALLHALDVQAVPVLVSTRLGDGIDWHLPMLGLFDHIIVRATIGEKVYWLDGTRSGDRLDRLPVPAFGFGLPVEPRGATLVRIMPPPLDQPNSLSEVEIDVSKGVTLAGSVKASMTLRGDEALGVKLSFANLSPDQRDQALRAYWREQLDGLEIERVAEGYDPVTGEQKMTLAGQIKLDWQRGWYEIDAGQLGYKADFHREPGPTPDAPYQVGYPIYSRRIQKIILPADYHGRSIRPSEIRQTIAGTEYARKVSFERDTVVVEASTRTSSPEFPAAQAPAAQAALRTLNDDRVHLRQLSNVLTGGEKAALMDAKPTDPASRIRRGYLLSNVGRFDEAIAEFTAVLATDPKNANVLANRGLTYVWLDKVIEARTDLDAAAAINRGDPVLVRGRALLNERENKFDDAIEGYGAALKIEPNNTWALMRRAKLLDARNRHDAALADASAAIRINPLDPEPYLLRANIMRSRSDVAGVIAEARALLAAAPGDIFAQVAAARIFTAVELPGEAQAAFDRALAIKPEPFIYVNRGYARPRSDLAGRRADFEAALKLEPKHQEALVGLAHALSESGDRDGAVRRIGEALGAVPDSPELLLQRGVIFAMSGQQALAERDFATVRTRAKTASSLNELCWSQATAGVALAAALADCDASLVLAPDNAATVDSRALVLLRLGRIDEAVTAYDRALALRPGQGASLYGRAVAHARKGDKARADADAAAARKIYPNVDADFARYGVKL